MDKLRPFRQARPHWDYAAELVLIAATTRKMADLERATAQLERVRFGGTIGCSSFLSREAARQTASIAIPGPRRPTISRPIPKPMTRFAAASHDQEAIIDFAAVGAISLFQSY
jgi:hypothetical protein